jgi:hypothetical protein
MTVMSAIEDLGIKEVLHFTTNQGLTGTLYSNALKSRQRLEKDRQLEYIFKPNSAFRKDALWLDFVNLSVSRINSGFFNVSAGRWHRDRDIWWCILSFDPVILSHPGVWFATTNNIYTGVKRQEGTVGLRQMFSEKVVRWSGNVIDRKEVPLNCPTCEQAEVLYPGEIPTKFIRRIYVATEADADEVHGNFSGIGHSPIEVVVSRHLFQQL